MSYDAPAAPAAPAAPRTEPKRFIRTRHDKMLGGVAGGLANYLNVDPTIVRVGWVVALVLGFPATILAYVIAWAITPQEQ